MMFFREGHVNIQGKYALVTGGSRGIGKETVKALMAKGASVLFTFNTGRDEAEALVRSLRPSGTISAYPCDIRDGRQIDDLIRQVRAQDVALDILVNNAGAIIPGALSDATPERWQEAFDLHVKGPALFARAFAEDMKAKRNGVIVNLGSVAGIRSVPGAVMYGTVKGAVIQMTRAMARELAEFNVRVVCVSPGIIRTDIHRAMTPEQKQFNEQARIPLHREGRPEEVAQLIVALIENDYITGENVMIDGGLTMRIA